MRDPVRGHLRGPRWRRVSHGLYVPAEHGGALLAAWSLVLPPGAAFTHLTAAALHGLWLPPLPVTAPSFVAVRDGGGYPRRPGLRVLRHGGDVSVGLARGLPTVSVPEALLACARDLGLLDLVVLGDAALHARLATPDELASVASGRRHGSPALRHALPWLDGRSESPYESLLRVLLTVCDVKVQPQHEVVVDGDFVARGDLWLVGTRTLHEHDGAHHLTREQQREDLRRVRALTDAGYDRRGFVKEDVLRQPETILRDADRALGRPHRPERLQEWRRMLAASAFSAEGRHRLARRWAA